ncbi:hypothetical protein FJZ27_03540 [Candidatus Peribacteria bacterium]|nr:hypothetical protein [Candidatus Peribacteria bacterium]
MLSLHVFPSVVEASSCGQKNVRDPEGSREDLVVESTRKRGHRRSVVDGRAASTEPLPDVRR